MDLDTCKSVCGPHGSLFPHPTLSKIAQQVSEFQIDGDSFEIPVEYQGNDKLTHLLNRAKESFKSKIYAMSGSDSVSPVASPSTPTPSTLKIVISIQRPDDLTLDLDTAECYKLSVSMSATSETVTVKAESPTVFGYLHALETLSQLCSYDRFTRSYFIASTVDIDDAPKFKYREVYNCLYLIISLLFCRLIHPIIILSSKIGECCVAIVISLRMTQYWCGNL